VTSTHFLAVLGTYLLRTTEFFEAVPSSQNPSWRDNHATAYSYQFRQNLLKSIGNIDFNS